MLSLESISGLRETRRVLIKDTGYVYLLPHPALRSRISNYTISFPGPVMLSDNYTVLPHGSATLTFCCSENNITGQLFGPITRPACVGRQANKNTLLVIVEFQPAGYHAFSRLPQKELADCVLPFDLVHPVLNRLIAERLAEAVDADQLAEELDRLFLAYLEDVSSHQGFTQASRAIIHRGGLISVRELSQNVFYSERQLGRLFDEYMGVTVKSFARLVRVNRSIRLLRRHDISLTQVCLESGYYDLSHYIHDFTALCGLTPQQHRQHMSDFYNEIAKF